MITDLQLIKSQKPQTTHCKRSERAVLSDVRDNPQAASEDRRVGARSELAEERDSSIVSTRKEHYGKRKKKQSDESTESR